ncbi:MAG: 16S rRNA (guanine(527)-N(7))-methyltransferase RsmG [Lachnospiraceae bacterium]
MRHCVCLKREGGLFVDEKLIFIEQNINDLGFHIDSVQTRQFFDYYLLLVEWNKVMNLTAITDFEEVVRKHFVDSLSIIYQKSMEDVDNMIDIGTGAGFPGLPVKIMFPHLKVTLLDSLKKRVDFLNTVIGKLDLTGVETLHGRAEDYARLGERREKYELCVSRAVANLSVLSEYCLPFVKRGGTFISYKSGDMVSEMENAKSAVFLLGGKIESVKYFELPGTEIKRSLVTVQKVNGCPAKYPRKAGTAAKNPL